MAFLRRFCLAKRPAHLQAIQAPPCSEFFCCRCQTSWCPAQGTIVCLTAASISDTVDVVFPNWDLCRHVLIVLYHNFPASSLSDCLRETVSAWTGDCADESTNPARALDRGRAFDYSKQVFYLPARDGVLKAASGTYRFGSRAMETCEPCQDGNIAALSGIFHVPRGCLALRSAAAFRPRSSGREFLIQQGIKVSK